MPCGSGVCSIAKANVFTPVFSSCEWLVLHSSSLNARTKLASRAANQSLPGPAALCYRKDPWTHTCQGCAQVSRMITSMHVSFSDQGFSCNDNRTDPNMPERDVCFMRDVSVHADLTAEAPTCGRRGHCACRQGDRGHTAYPASKYETCKWRPGQYSSLGTMGLKWVLNGVHCIEP